MRRFFIDSAEQGNLSLSLTGQEAQHAARVIRVQEGEKMTVLNGKGGEFLCLVRGVSKSLVTLDVLEYKKVPPLLCQITLLQSVPRAGVMEEIIQKATELGVCRIIPLVTERTEVKFSGKDFDAKLQKWNLIAQEACKQCGNTWLPKIEKPQSFKDCLGNCPEANIAFVASLEQDSRPVRYWKSKNFFNAKGTISATLWVGPEGDFSPTEYAALKENRVYPITLGSLVLRCDTAVISALSIIGAELGNS